MRQQERAASNLAEDVLQLCQAVRGIDVHQDQPGLCRGELRHHPLGIVWRPDSHAVPGLEAQGQQARRTGGDPIVQFGVGPPHALMVDHQRFSVGPPSDGPVEMGADRLADKRSCGGAVHVAAVGHWAKMLSSTAGRKGRGCTVPAVRA